jgi:hypothetical protein
MKHSALSTQHSALSAEILTAIDSAEASLARGEGRTITRESMRQLAEEVKQRGRKLLSRESRAASL